MIRAGLGTCRDCRREIRWTRTAKGRRLAVDPAPDPDGNTAVYRDALGVWRSRRPTAEEPVNRWERMYMPHPATCPARQEQLTLPVTLPRVVRLSDRRRRRRGR